MTDDTMSVPTTGADFDDAFAAAFREGDLDDGLSDYGHDGFDQDDDDDDEFEPIDNEGDSDFDLSYLSPDDDDDDDSSDDYEDDFDIDDNAEDGDLQGSDLSENVADVADLIQNGDTEAALKRLGDYGRGVEKLQVQRAEALQNVDNLRTLFTGIGSHDQEALHILEDILASHGTSIEGLYSAKAGMSMANFGGPTDNGGTASPQEMRLAQLEAQMRMLGQDREDAEWVAHYGHAIAAQVEQETGLRLDPQLIAQIRYDLPANATVEDIEEAVMRADPRAYRRAAANRSGPSTAPNHALISKGGKGSAKADPRALLGDALKFEAYLKG